MSARAISGTFSLLASRLWRGVRHARGAYDVVRGHGVRGPGLRPGQQQGPAGCGREVSPPGQTVNTPGCK
jgi:hypothetical protein